MKLLEIKRSHLYPTKRYDAVFQIGNTIRVIPFGSNLDNYTIHKDANRKRLYLNRHRSREDWNDPLTPGSLSRWILWNLPDINSSIRDFKNRFNL
jgi:hypothetical protein